MWHDLCETVSSVWLKLEPRVLRCLSTVTRTRLQLGYDFIIQSFIADIIHVLIVYQHTECACLR